VDGLRAGDTRTSAGPFIFCHCASVSVFVMNVQLCALPCGQGATPPFLLSPYYFLFSPPLAPNPNPNRALDLANAKLKPKQTSPGTKLSLKLKLKLNRNPASESESESETGPNRCHYNCRQTLAERRLLCRLIR